MDEQVLNALGPLASLLYIFISGFKCNMYFVFELFSPHIKLQLVNVCPNRVACETLWLILWQYCPCCWFVLSLQPWTPAFYFHYILIFMKPSRTLIKPGLELYVAHYSVRCLGCVTVVASMLRRFTLCKQSFILNWEIVVYCLHSAGQNSTHRVV